MAIDTEHLRTLLADITAATKPAQLRDIYRQADNARLLAAVIDANGQTLEGILWERKRDLEQPKAARSA